MKKYTIGIPGCVQSNNAMMDGLSCGYDELVRRKGSSSRIWKEEVELFLKERRKRNAYICTMEDPSYTVDPHRKRREPKTSRTPAPFLYSFSGFFKQTGHPSAPESGHCSYHCTAGCSSPSR